MTTAKWPFGYIFNYLRVGTLYTYIWRKMNPEHVLRTGYNKSQTLFVGGSKINCAIKKRSKSNKILGDSYGKKSNLIFIRL